MEKKEFEFYQDIKVTVWGRQRFTIEAESREAAREIAKKYAESDVAHEIEDVDTEYLFDTEELLLPEENGGCSTIEVYEFTGNYFNNEPIADNSIKQDKETTSANYFSRHYSFKKEVESKIIEMLGDKVKYFSDMNYEVLVQESRGGTQFPAMIVSVSANGFIVYNNGDEEKYELMDMNLADLCIILDHLISSEW